MDKVKVSFNCKDCKHKAICRYSCVNKSRSITLAKVSFIDEEAPLTAEIKCKHYVLEIGK